METCSVVLTFESVDEILWCDHSNETSLAVLLHGTICYSIFYIFGSTLRSVIVLLAMLYHVSGPLSMFVQQIW